MLVSNLQKIVTKLLLSAGEMQITLQIIASKRHRKKLLIKRPCVHTLLTVRRLGKELLQFVL